VPASSASVADWPPTGPHGVAVCTGGDLWETSDTTINQKDTTMNQTNLHIALIALTALAVCSDAAQPEPVAVHDTSLNPFIVPRGGLESFGDPFPTFWDGVWHLYTLRAGLGQIYHLTSTDLVRWTEHQPAMVGHSIATGTVLRHDGKYYLFFTQESSQTIRLVVSDNPWRFDYNKNRIVAKADNKVYLYKAGWQHFRDPYVFFNEAERRWWMLLEANNGNRVTVGLFTSRDLLSWEQHDPIFTDDSPGQWGTWRATELSWEEGDPNFKAAWRELLLQGSCPQVFEHEGRWYLTLLDEGIRVYEADSLHGPWERAGYYESMYFTASSRHASDGKRRLCWGFFTRRNTPERNIKAKYGGPMGVGRELVFNAAGRLGVRPLPELVAAIREPAHNAALFDCARPLRGTWEIDAEKREFRCTGEDGGALLLDLPGENPDYYFEAEIVLASPESRADLLVRTTESFDRGYRVIADAGAGAVAIRQAKTGGGTFYKRDHPVADGKPVKVQIFVCDSILEAFLDDHLSLSTRVLDRSAHRAAIEITGGRATIRNPLLHRFKEGG